MQALKLLHTALCSDLPRTEKAHARADLRNFSGCNWRYAADVMKNIPLCEGPDGCGFQVSELPFSPFTLHHIRRVLAA